MNFTANWKRLAQRVLGDQGYCTFLPHPKGNPEDLIFFYRHLSLGGKLLRIDEPLLTYRYHKDAVSFGVDRSEMFSVKY